MRETRLRVALMSAVGHTQEGSRWTQNIRSAPWIGRTSNWGPYTADAASRARASGACRRQLRQL